MLLLLNYPVNLSLAVYGKYALALLLALGLIVALVIAALALIWFVSTVVRDG